MKVEGKCAACGRMQCFSEGLERNGQFVCFECSWQTEGMKILLRPKKLPSWVEGFREFVAIVERNGHWLALPHLRGQLLKILNRLQAEARQDLDR